MKRYDVFISHASEDKTTIVRDLAHALRSKRFAVWYDEFSLHIGDGLRKSIDEGLAQSRFGVVVLSKAFFAKQWTQWELDGLVQRQMSDQKVILPVWHEVSRDDVATFSPPLANIVAANTRTGMDTVVQQIAAVLRPEKSSLEVAYETLCEFGADPPPVSDDWWLDVAREYGYPYSLVEPWRFRTPACPSNVPAYGWELAWTAMQWVWCEDARYRRVTCITHPIEVLKFIEEMPGLKVAAQSDIESLLIHAPQLAIPGFGGQFEARIQEYYGNSMRRHSANHKQEEKSKIGSTRGEPRLLCDPNVALRHPTFGNHDAVHIAENFCGTFQLDFFDLAFADVLFWLLSTRSAWLENKYRDILLRGLSEWGVWGWGIYGRTSSPEEVKAAPHYGELFKYLYKLPNKESLPVQLSSTAMDDLRERIAYSARVLGLPEGVEEIVQEFLKLDFLEGWLRAHRVK